MTATSDDIPNPSLAERRHAIFARVVAKLEGRGTPIDQNPEFLALVERWTNGEISVTDVTTGYLKTRRASHGKQSLPAPPADEVVHARMSQENLLAELENIIGVFEPGELPSGND